jgi:hypothetical protein
MPCDASLGLRAIFEPSTQRVVRRPSLTTATCCPAAHRQGVAPRRRVGVAVGRVDDVLQEALRGQVEAAGRLERRPAAVLAGVAAAALPAEDAHPGVVADERVGQLEERLDGVAALERHAVQRGARAGAQDRAAVRALAAVEAQAGVRGLAGVVVGGEVRMSGPLFASRRTVRSLPLPVRSRRPPRRRRPTARPVEAPVGGRVPVDDRRGRPGRGQRRRVEAGEPVREVDRQAEPVTSPVSSMVSASSGVRAPGRLARNHGANVSTSIVLRARSNRVQPDHPRAAVVAVLVVGDVHVDVVPGVVAQHGAPGGQ